MALTRSVLYHVPVEILREIVWSVDTARTMAMLSRASRLFNAITTPILYRHISLETVESTLECFDTLVKTPKFHDHVRTLRIVIDPSDPGALRAYVPTDMIFPLEAGLRPLRKLEALHLRIPDFSDAYLVIFATLVLPELRVLSTFHTGSFSPILSSFLNHHQHLTHLELIRPFNIRRAAAAELLPLTYLPHLRVYRGCAAYAAKLVEDEVDLDALLAALAFASTPKTPFALTFLADGGDEAQTVLFPALVKWLPHVRTLVAGSFMGPPRRLKPPAIEKIDAAIEQLTNLTSFDFDNAWPTVEKPIEESVERDLTTLTAWGASCPTLMTSRLHTRTWTRHSGEWVLLYDPVPPPPPPTRNIRG
ncbi:hypothetical protein C8R46DRAFT_1101582 [Mycena filopes]|nr:hypothetical protein C8R46DRAFT_1101582 [Mycena filopes]